MEDLISRQAAIEAVGINTWAGFRLKDLPSAQPEQKKGKWIECERVEYTQFHPDYSSFYSTFRCTSCLKENYRKEKYCPNCGADMMEE